jgi:hypothetical protein
MHVDDERKRPSSGRQIEVALELDAVVGGVDDVLAEFGFRLDGIGHGRSQDWLEGVGLQGFPPAEKIPVARKFHIIYQQDAEGVFR